VLGLLSIAGFPLTAGFPARWSLLYLLAQIHPTAAILLLLAMISLLLVSARGLVALLAPDPAVAVAPVAEPPEPLTPLAVAVYGLGFAVALVLGLFPQWVLPAVAGTAEALTRFNP
jgi:formate hydrogenlyase subunit 3/multisubunit Na+/H+ antiporter MnhD subunit